MSGECEGGHLMEATSAIREQGRVYMRGYI